MNIEDAHRMAVVPAMKLLPAELNAQEALVQVHAIAIQESLYLYRVQLNDGPAHSFWQMERNGGVKGVLKHPASIHMAEGICLARGIKPNPMSVWSTMEYDDVLGAAFARLLLWTDPKALPRLGQENEAWKYYQRNWRPGKPHPDTWPHAYGTALKFIKELKP